ncbi:PepSY-associated TM helix domain-containing protein [Streptomyces liangshanensis]|uniref:PepSY domain-containing protein n=1 Tax=Streptomyces liangshanensis TaxID=2717324 RepID=A0A6G9H483_9ACTN|nr:PepSY domain-containing protein [Streptomyces liangshanensis]QIQ05099.1 PepSY domain-containing protein [Streptomyces liangshanensis]
MAIDDPLKDADPVAETATTVTTDPATSAPTTSASAWSALRPLVLRLHFYAGVLVAPFLLVAAVSGLLYSLSFQAEKVVYRHELRVPAGDRVLPLETQVNAARTAHPDGKVTSVRPSSEEGATTRVLMSTPEVDEGKSLAVFVDPYTAEVRGQLASYGSSGALPLRAWLSELHRHLHLGEPGRLYSELAASWLWVVALGGLVLWLGRRRTSKRALLLPESGATGRRRTLTLHGSLGLWAVTGLVLLSATGLTWSTYAGANIGKVQDQLGGSTPSVSATLDGGTGSTGGGHEGHEDMPGMTDDMPGMEGMGGMDVGMDLAVVAARQAGLDGPLQVTLPTAGNGYVVAQTDTQFPVRLDSVAVDPANGMVIDELRFADYPVLAQLTRFGIDAHMGVFLGLVNQLALAALALSLVLIILWGYRMWWQRRPTQERKAGVGRPMARGAWRKVPLRVLLPLAAVTAVVGWFVPLLGISFVAFLLLDGALGLTAKARARAAR